MIILIVRRVMEDAIIRCMPRSKAGLSSNNSIRSSSDDVVKKKVEGNDELTKS